MTRPPVLVVEHETICPPGWMGEWLADAGCTLDVRRPYAGEALPSHLRDHAGMVVLGGSMDATSDAEFPWLGQVKRLVREAAGSRTPVLGICLGHQVVAVALGGTVVRNPRGQQLGVLEVGWTAAAREDRLCGPLVDGSLRAIQWNNDIVLDPPPGTVTLASTPGGELQAARFAPSVWGVQWHPEVGAEIVSVWAESDRDAVQERGLDVDAYLAAMAAAHDDLRSAWRPLAESFAAVSRDGVEAADTW